MKANELSCKDLMIGDWVIFHDSGYASDETTWKEDRVCQIDAIDVDVRVKWYDEDGYKEDWPHVSTFCLSPIPLTPEILEKNGFEYKEGETGMYGVTTAPYYICDGVPFEVFCDGEPFAIWFKEPVNIKFVHQLQHALRLCDISKEIEL